MSALVEKKIGFDGSRTLIQGGFRSWCNAGSIFAQGMQESYKIKKVTKVKSIQAALGRYNAIPVMLSDAKHL